MAHDDKVLEMLKYSMDVIRDMNINFGALSQSINGLVNAIENLPKMHDIIAQLESLKQTLLVKGEAKLDCLADVDQIAEVERNLQASLNDLINKINSLEQFYKMVIDLNKQQHDQKQSETAVKIEKIKADVEKNKNSTAIILKILGWGAGIGIFASGILTAVIKYVWPHIFK